jgi:hypothetical protein
MKRLQSFGVSAVMIMTALFAAGSFLPSFAYGQNSLRSAEISRFEGDVFMKSRTIRPLNKWIPLKSDMHINYFFYNGDEIKTAKGKAEIRFDNGDVVQLAEATDLTIVEGMKKRRVLGHWSNEYPVRTITLSCGNILVSRGQDSGRKTEIESPVVVATMKGKASSFTYDPATGQTAVRCGKDDILELDDINGRIQLILKDGEVRVKADPDGRLILQSVSGKQTIVIWSGIKAHMDAGGKIAVEGDETRGKSVYESKSGDIVLEAPNGSRAELNSGEKVEVGYDAGTGTTTYESLSGNITVGDALGNTTFVGSGGILTVR